MTALDTTTIEEGEVVQPTQVVEKEQVETEVEQPVQTESAETQETESTTGEGTQPETVIKTEPQEFEIEGLGMVKVDDIKEWQRGNLRQSDYTRKTQELAKQREENADALEVYNYLRDNPNIIQTLKAIDEQGVVNQNIINKATPESDMLREVMFKQRSMELDGKLEQLKQEHGDFDAVELLNTASAMKTDDLEKVWKVINYDKIVINEQQAIEKAKAQIKAELEQNRQSTQTIVSTPAQQVQQTAQVLTPDEIRVATGMGLSKEEYSKWKNSR